MAGACSSRSVIAANKAGILGALGAGMMTPEEIRKSVQEIRSESERPFNINLQMVDLAMKDIDLNEGPHEYTDWVAGYYQSLAVRIKDSSIKYSHPPIKARSFLDQFHTCVELKPAVLSLTFGILTKDQVDLCHANGIKVFGTATCVEEGIAWEKVGADAVCAQGIEAGGHRGSFLADPITGPGIFALLQELATALSADYPIIACGGIMNGHALTAALKLGAAAGQVGTAFLASTESPIPDFYKRALIAAPDSTATVFTKAFSGKYARGLRNKFTELGEHHASRVLPYPIQNSLTQPLRKLAVQLGDADSYSLWAGQGVGLVDQIKSTDEIVKQFEHEFSQSMDAE